MKNVKRFYGIFAGTLALAFFVNCYAALALEGKIITRGDREASRKKALDELQERFKWWPTDAKPGPVKDTERGGYWWWPTKPGKITPWGNRGYVYVYKIIFDYKQEELAPPKEKELRPSLLVRKIIKNVKIYYDYDKSEIRDDAVPILESAVKALEKNPGASILITGNCDIRGSETYNLKLGRQRAEAVKNFMLNKGIDEKKVIIVSRGKLDAIAPVSDLEGMQKDRNAQFMVAEVQEVMLPYNSGQPQEEGVKPVEEGKYIVEKTESVESAVKVSTKEYVVQKGDTLWTIAAKECGSGYRWKYLYELNKEKINNPNKLTPGQTILIPVE
ncbi:MAG: OmpA family protein [Candidatus Omnitrophica bacterium]|nr:OmpA family protein [Candidatus Omnitrophota bacterium]